MVETITRYRTEDGLDFSTREEAEEHERTAVPRMLSDDVAGVVAALRELGEADGEYRLSYYDFSPPIAWRFDAATQSFAEIGGVQ